MELVGIRYEFHVSENRKIKKIYLSFSDKDFFHLAGLQHLKDIALPRNRNKTISDILSGKIDEDTLKKSKYYANLQKQERAIEMRIEELQYLQQYLDTDNIIKIFSLKESPRLQSDIDAEYVIESKLLDRKSVYIFLKERKEKKGWYCVVSFFVKGKLMYGGRKLYWMLKRKYDQDKMSLLYQHPNYKEKIKEEENKAMSTKIDENQMTRKTVCEQKTRELSCGIIDILVKERKEQGFTQQMIADETGMKTSNVTRFESCRCVPTLDVLMRYADALGKRIKIELVD